MEISKSQIAGIILLGLVTVYIFVNVIGTPQIDTSLISINNIAIITIVILCYPIFKIGYNIGNDMVTTNHKPSDNNFNTTPKLNIKKLDNKL
jgi:hypothetical protein